MNKEELALQFRHYAKVTKDLIVKGSKVTTEFVVKGTKVTTDFVVKEYHRFADFLAKRKLERKNNGSNIILGMQFTKCLVILMSIFYMLISLFMITVGTSTYLAHESFYDLWLDFKVLTIFWICSGVILTFIAIFGMIGAFKESVQWTNIYGFLLMATFVLQILTSIAAFCLIVTGSSRYHASNIVFKLMLNYVDNTDSAQKMDWIQNTFECCGGEGPSDWGMSFVTPISTLKSEPLTYKTPSSCCTKDSSYQNMTCDKYYEKGCTVYVNELLSETILIIGTLILAIGVVQILGMVCAFTLARLIRQTKSYRLVQKWNNQYETVFETPTYVNYTPLNNSDDVKQT